MLLPGLFRHNSSWSGITVRIGGRTLKERAFRTLQNRLRERGTVTDVAITDSGSQSGQEKFQELSVFCTALTPASADLSETTAGKDSVYEVDMLCAEGHPPVSPLGHWPREGQDPCSYPPEALVQSTSTSSDETRNGIARTVEDTDGILAESPLDQERGTFTVSPENVTGTAADEAIRQGHTAQNGKTNGRLKETTLDLGHGANTASAPVVNGVLTDYTMSHECSTVQTITGNDTVTDDTLRVENAVPSAAASGILMENIMHQGRSVNTVLTYDVNDVLTEDTTHGRSSTVPPTMTVDDTGYSMREGRSVGTVSTTDVNGTFTGNTVQGETGTVPTVAVELVLDPYTVRQESEDEYAKNAYIHGREYPCTVDMLPDGLQYPLLLNVAVCRAREVMMRDGALVVRGPLLTGREMTLLPRHKEYLKCTRHIDVKLLDRDEWAALAAIPHEMVVNGVGRKLRPPLVLKVTGLEKSSLYSLALIFVPLGVRYLKCGSDNGVWSESDDVVDTDRFAPEYVHASGLTSGAEWMARRINFEALRLTLWPCSTSAQVPLEQRRMYQPVLQFRCKRHSTAVNVVLPELRFIAVCSYQNPRMRNLKACYGRNYGLNVAANNVAPGIDARLACKRKFSSAVTHPSGCGLSLGHHQQRLNGTANGYNENEIVDYPESVPRADADANLINTAPCSSCSAPTVERSPVREKRQRLCSPEDVPDKNEVADVCSSAMPDSFPTVDDFYKQLTSDVLIEDGDLEAALDDDFLSSLGFLSSESLASEIRLEADDFRSPSARRLDVEDDTFLRSQNTLGSKVPDSTLSTLRYLETLLPDDLLLITPDQGHASNTRAADDGPDDRLRTPVTADDERFHLPPVADDGFPNGRVSDSFRIPVVSRGDLLSPGRYQLDDNRTIGTAQRSDEDSDAVTLEEFQLSSCYAYEDSWFESDWKLHAASSSNPKFP